MGGNLMVSCDYLDVVPDQIPTLDNAFSDRYTAWQYLSSCYWAVPRTGGWNTNPALLGSMEIVFNKEQLTQNGMRAALGLNNATSSLMNYWGSTGNDTRTLYAGIRECNTFLDNIEKVQDLPIQEKNRMIAEAKVLKAYMHFSLLRYYGPICPLKESAPVNESTQGARVYREKIDDCFAYIIQVLDEVINDKALPVAIANRSSELGRFTHASACSFKAKVLVYWASPLFNGNTEYNDFLNQDGEPFFNQTVDQSRWTKAVDACKVALEACTEGNIRLFQKTDLITQIKMSDTTRLVNTLRSAVTELLNTNMEFIMGNQADPARIGSAIQLASMPQLEPGNSSVTCLASVPFSTVDLFYSDHGVPIDEDTAWVNSGRYLDRFKIRTGDEEHRYYIGIDENTAAMNFNREPRFYATLGFDRGKWHGNSYKNLADEETPVLKNIWGEYSSFRNASNYNATGYFPKKLVALSSAFATESSINIFTRIAYPEIRYSDLLLLYAEALNETVQGEDGHPDGEVYDILDQVRVRAGLEGVVESWRKYSMNSDKPFTKKGMREIIQRERNIELACEGQHYWDSRRWRTALTEQNRIIQGWNVLGDSESTYYTVTSLYIQRFAHRDYFAPVPESDLIKNPQLIQNPGW
jgi:hypothetical protein